MRKLALGFIVFAVAACTGDVPGSLTSPSGGAGQAVRGPAFATLAAVAPPCTPKLTITEGDLFPGGITEFLVTAGVNQITIDPNNNGTGLRALTTTTSTNAVVNIPAFAVGTPNPVVVTFTVTDPNLPVNIVLRAASLYHAANIRAQCACTPSLTVSEDPTLFPGGLASFTITPGDGTLTVDHVNSGTGLQTFTQTSASNAVVVIPGFAAGTFNPVVATYTITDPALAVDINLRATSTYHGSLIRLACGTPQAAHR